MVQCEGFLSEIDPFAQGQIHVIVVSVLSQRSTALEKRAVGGGGTTTASLIRVDPRKGAARNR